MHYPMLQTRTAAALTVPRLDGGINRADAAHRLADNQLVAAENVWYKDDLLTTRPGTVTTETPATAYRGSASYRTQQIDGTAVKYTVVPATAGKVFIAAYEMTATGDALPIAGGTVTASATDGLLFRHAGAWHILLDSGEIFKEHSGEWEIVSPYVPVVMTGGRPVSYDNRVRAANGTAGEAPNLLTTARECRFTSDGAYDAGAEEDNRHIVYKLPTPYDAASGLTATVAYADYSGGDPVIKTWQYPRDIAQVFGSGVFLVDNVPAASGEWSGYRDAVITFDASAGTGIVRIGIRMHTVIDGVNVYKYQPLPYVADNNVSIRFHATGSSRAAEVGGMRRLTWFGGDRGNTHSGTRMFLTGHPSARNLVRWSAVNNPYYYPEPNAAYVGDSSDPVTAFGKQGDLLVMFKPHEIYSTPYATDTEENGETARLPITPISAYTGCDCPESVRLVNNRLVWAHTGGHVYALASVGSLSEKNVRCLSDRIEPLTLDASCTGGEYRRHYVLASGRNVWLLNTDSPAFLSSGTASESEANHRLAWWLWTFGLPEDAEMLVSDGNSLTLCLPTVAQGGSFYHRQVTLSSDPEDADGVPFSVTTKPWDFGRPDRRKAVRQATLFVAAGDGADLRFDYITDTATWEDADIMTGTGGETVRRLTPNVNRARAFGLRLHGVGRVAVGDMRIWYALQGAVR